MNADGTGQTPLTNNTADDMEPWASPDGSIVFLSNRDGDYEIYKVNHDGSSPVNLTDSPTSTDLDPSVSPDGSRIAFSTDRTGDSEIFLMNADGSNPIDLTNTPSASEADAWFSPDGTKIAFRTDRTGDNEIFVMNSDGSSPVNLSNSPAFEELPAFSPDGSRIAFVSDRDGNSEIYVMNSDGTNQTRLTNNSSGESHPSFSPDGSKIYFVSDRDGNNEIYVMNATDGSNQVRLTNAVGSDFAPNRGIQLDRDDDGQGDACETLIAGVPRIAFATQRGGTVSHVYTMNVDGSNQVPLTSGGLTDNREPAFSPDGTRIAFSSERDGDSEIFVMNADGSNQTQVTFNNDLDYAPKWSPDGTRVALVRRDSISSLSASIVTMFADGSGQVIITPPSSGINEYPAWSPDGTKIAFTRIFTSDAERDIYIVNSDGSNSTNPVRLTNNAPVYDNHPVWSPDGLRLAFTSDRDQPGNWEIYTMNAADGGAVTRLTNNAGSDLFPAWSQDGGQIVFASGGATAGPGEIYVMRSDGAYVTNISNNAAPDTTPSWQTNIAWSGATSVGSNVAVQLGLVSVTFSGVTQAGTTSQYAINPASTGPAPSGFTFGPGLPAYEIFTNAVYIPPVTVCFQVPAVTSASAFAALRLFHYENGALLDRTSLRDFATRSICAEVTSLSPFVVAQALAPTAANVSLSGRVLDSSGQGIARATLSLTDISGNTRIALSSPFGYYRFEDVQSGQVYVLSIEHKRYVFDPNTHVLNVVDEITDLDFLASPAKGKMRIVNQQDGFDL